MTISEAQRFDMQQKQDMLAYIGYMSQSGETVQAALGWDKPAPKKRAKK
ncbi:MAG: hypothetical protein RL374_1488 [Actinomycetota bacterium]|jgi:hypothetical protein